MGCFFGPFPEKGGWEVTPRAVSWISHHSGPTTP